jgi:hypothetical protein
VIRRPRERLGVNLMARKERQIPKRVNFFDGQRVTETDVDTEQIHKISVTSDMVIDFHGSGVVKSDPFASTVLLDTRFPGRYVEDSDDENESKEDIEGGSYDGMPIYFDRQPSDNVRGNRLILNLVDADIIGRKTTKALLLGWAFDGINEKGQLVAELIEFKKNGEALTRHYYREVIAVMFNNFSGGIGKTELEASKVSEDLITATSGYIQVYEAEPLKVYPFTESSHQVESPNIGLRDFITSDTENSIEDEIEEALGAAISISDLYIELEGKEEIKFESDADTTLSYGQKFLSRSNNIQRIDLLLSAEEDETADSGSEFNWSGDLVISIHELASEPKCPTDAVPSDLLDFDPELSPIVEMSYSQEDLEDLGYVLDDTLKVVSFNFAGTLIADPNIEPSIEEGKYYAFLVSRRGDNRTGTLVMEKGYDPVTKKNEEGVPLTTLEQFGRQISKFTEFDPNTERYVDDSSSSLWYIVHSNTVEIVNGTAYSDDGYAITLEKTEDFVGGAEISKFNRNIPLASISSGAKNYVVLSHIEEFTTPNVHPRTGNQVFTRIKDTGAVSVVDADGLAELMEDTTPLLLAKIIDNNTRDAQSITGTFALPGMVKVDRVVINEPDTELLTENLVGRILIPDTDCECTAKYRIAKIECDIVKAGDLDRDGELTLSDLDPLLDIVGSTINSENTERNILGGDLDIEDFLLSDLDANETVDGFDIELLEDAIDGYVNFTAAEEIRFLTLRLENVLDASDNPTIFIDTASSGSTEADTNEITFAASSDNIALAIRVGDTVEIESASSDAGVYTVTSKQIADDDLTVTFEVDDSNGDQPSFVGDTGFNVTVISGTEVNTFADNNKLMDIPFASTNYEIAFVEAPFDDTFLEVCDLRRFVGVSFLEEASDPDCVCEEDDCIEPADCEPIYKNQTYVPDDLYIGGAIYSEPGVPYHGDIEYAQIQMPLPPGSITDCAVNLYTNFIKADDTSSCKTAAGYPAMKYSDGTYVGCDDSGDDTDMTKNRVKISHAIASLYVDALVDGYATDGYADETVSITNEQLITELFTDYSYDGFSDWTDNPSNNTTITTITNPTGVNQPATFELTTTADSGKRFGRLDIASEADDFEGDFVLDWTASRSTWPSGSMTAGQVSSAMEILVTNDDSSTATYQLGWIVKNDGVTNIFFKGERTNSVGTIISSFEHYNSAPDSIGDEVLFRFRRINDVITAHYVVPGTLDESDSPFGQYVRIGTNPDVQAGSGSVSTSFGIVQDGGPTAALTFYTRLHEVVVRSSYTPDDAPSNVIISRDASTNEMRRVAMTFPINLTSKTSVVSADLILTSKTSDTITSSFNVIPLDIVNADNLSKYYDYPTDQDVSHTVSFQPGAITDGGEISIDVSGTVRSMLANTGHLPGFLKGFIIEPDTDADASFEIEDTATLEIGYEDTTTGVIFKVGVSVDASTGIATFNTKNILYDAILEECRTVINFGVYLKKSGFANSDVYVPIADLNRIGLGTCSDEEALDDDNECYFIAGSTATGVFVEGPFPCNFFLP